MKRIKDLTEKLEHLGDTQKNKKDQFYSPKMVGLDEHILSKEYAIIFVREDFTDKITAMGLGMTSSLLEALVKKADSIQHPTLDSLFV